MERIEVTSLISARISLTIIWMMSGVLSLLSLSSGVLQRGNGTFSRVKGTWREAGVRWDIACTSDNRKDFQIQFPRRQVCPTSNPRRPRAGNHGQREVTIFPISFLGFSFWACKVSIYPLYLKGMFLKMF